MASIAIMIGGALINATALVGRLSQSIWVETRILLKRRRRRGTILLWRSTSTELSRKWNKGTRLDCTNDKVTEQARRIWCTQIMLWSCTTRCIIKSLIWVFWLLQAKYFAKARWNDLRRWNGFGFGNGCQSFLVNYFKMERKLLRTEFSPKGFWKGFPAVKRLAKEAGVPEDDTKLWLMKQATWQIYLPALKHIPDQLLVLLMLQADSRSRELFRKFLSVDHWDGQKFFRLILGVNSWMMSRERWQSTMWG